MKRWSAVAIMNLSFGAAAEQHPTTACEFNGFGANPKLALTVISSVAYYGCSEKSNCLSMKLHKQQPIVIFRKSGDWICGYVENEDGAAPVWVPANQLSEVRVDPNPPVTAWVGSWTNGGNRIELRPTSDPSKLALTGHASWHGAGDVEHFGEVGGEVTTSGNHIHYSEGADACNIDLTLFGNHLVANDNDKCGGMNVRFWGIWTRAEK